jgi:hypothetical protein
MIRVVVVEAVGTTEMSVSFHMTARRNILKDHHLQFYSCHHHPISCPVSIVGSFPGT